MRISRKRTFIHPYAKWGVVGSKTYNGSSISSKPIGEPRSKPAVLFFSHPARRAIWVLDVCLDIDSSILVVCQSLYEDLLSMVVSEIELRLLKMRVHTAT